MTTYLDKRPGRAPHWRYEFMWRGVRYRGSAPSSDNTRTAARIAEREHLDRARQGVSGRSTPTVAAFVERFLAYQAQHVKPTTLENQQIHLEQHVVPHLGRLKLDAIRPRHLAELKAAWSCAPRTVNARLDTVRRLLALAVEWDLLPKAPSVESVKVPPDVPRFLTDSESAALVAAASPDWRTMIVVGLRTGLRIGELRGLQWGDVDWRTRTIHVRRTDPGRPDMAAGGPKGGATRVVPLTNDAHAALELARPTDPQPRDWIWPALPRRGKPADATRTRSASGCHHGIRAAVRDAGLSEPEGDEIAWHTLRHTYASQLVIRGVSLRIVQALLGHASIRLTERYAHLAPDATHHAAVAALDFAVAPPAEICSCGHGLDEHQAPGSECAHEERHDVFCACPRFSARRPKALSGGDE